MTLCDELAPEFSKVANDNPALVPLAEAFSNACQDLNRALRRTSTDALRAKREAADSARDRLFAGLQSHIDGDTDHFDPTQAEAANRLIAIFDRRATGLIRLSYDEQTAELDLLFKDLATPAAEADLASLGLSNWLDRLREANEKIQIRPTSQR
ncbi:MAG: hypothetical protein HC901_00415 [Bdellovibrionaceae bacterium]|nr:hypothetical protein [Pseudobdellovibrionaceae bacterium]